MSDRPDLPGGAWFLPSHGLLSKWGFVADRFAEAVADRAFVKSSLDGVRVHRRHIRSAVLDEITQFDDGAGPESWLPGAPVPCPTDSGDPVKGRDLPAAPPEVGDDPAGSGGSTATLGAAVGTGESPAPSSILSVGPNVDEACERLRAFASGAHAPDPPATETDGSTATRGPAVGTGESQGPTSFDFIVGAHHDVRPDRSRNIGVEDHSAFPVGEWTRVYVPTARLDECCAALDAVLSGAHAPDRPVVIAGEDESPVDRLTPELQAVIDALRHTYGGAGTGPVLRAAWEAYEASLRPQPVECLMTRLYGDTDPDGWNSAYPLDYPLDAFDVEVWRVTITPIEQVR